MPSWVVVWSDEKRMPGLLGPYTGFRAHQIADKLEEVHEVITTISSNKRRAKQEIKEHLVPKVGYKRASRNISNSKIGVTTNVE